MPEWARLSESDQFREDELATCSLVEDSPEAALWLRAAMEGQATAAIFGHIVGSVVWSDAKNSHGDLILPIDPQDLVEKINARRFPLLHEHDPGRPIGRVLGAEQFKTSDGQTFVAAVLGYYDATVLNRFETLGLDPSASMPPPQTLPPLPDDFRIVLATDPKEVDRSWVASIVRDTPVAVEPAQLSHNSAEAAQQLITLGVLFTVLVWNPLVKAFAEEAGKDLYKLAREGLRTLIGRIGECGNPIIEIQSSHQGCAVSFMLRGKDVARHYKAYDALPNAALRAQHLVETMVASGLNPARLMYEFQADSDLWAPSFAELGDGRLVSDNLTLIAVENLPTSLSLGLVVSSEEED